MRFLLCALFALCLVAVINTSPANDKKQAAAACSRDCGSYDPVCGKAQKASSKERLLSFGNECVMGNYNCAHADDPFVLKSKGECGGNVSVRLS